METKQTDMVESDHGAQADDLRLRVVIFKGLRNWVAQCLEYDIAAQAPTWDELPNRLRLAISAEIEFCRAHGERPFVRLPKAPQRYWAMWRGSQDVQDQKPWLDIPAVMLPKSAEAGA